MGRFVLRNRNRPSSATRKQSCTAPNPKNLFSCCVHFCVCCLSPPGVRTTAALSPAAPGLRRALCRCRRREPTAPGIAPPLLPPSCAVKLSTRNPTSSYLVICIRIWSNLKHVHVLEHLQQLCNWNLPFVGVCQVPKRFAKGKISSSPSVWYFWLGISQNSGPNYFCPKIFYLRGKFSRASCGRPSRTIPLAVAAISLARRRLVHVVEIRSRQLSQGAPRHPGRKEKRRWRAEKRRRRTGRSRFVGNYRDVGSTGTTRSPRFSGYQNCQAIVLMQKCQVWSIKCQVCQNA